MKAPMNGFLAATVMIGLAVVAPTDGTAQELRQRMVDSALALPDADNRSNALIKAIDPNLGSPDSLWVRAVARLVEDLILELDDPNALIWLRWAVRHYPSYTIPAVETEPEVIAALNRVRRELGTVEPVDTITTWDWTDARRTGQGTLRINPRGIPDGATVRIVGRGQVTDNVALDVGTYDVQVMHGGEPAAQVTRPILPGITTILNFNLPDIVVAEPGPTGPGPEPVPTTGGGGGFPIAIGVIGGLGALGAVAALVLGGSSDGPQTMTTITTGGIIINYPIP